MDRSKKCGVVILLCAILILSLGLLIGISDPHSEMTIDFVRSSNTLQGAVATLRLINRGQATIRVNAFCTIYWTNRLGVATDSFFQHDQGYLVLHPGQTNLVRVPAPSDAKTWETSFSYDVKPNALKLTINRIRYWMRGDWTPEMSFTGQFGPTITNEFLSADNGDGRGD